MVDKQNFPQVNFTQDWFEISNFNYLPAKPVVSVVMLAYQHASYLENAIDGVVMQKVNFPIELVIAEDCSPDETRNIAVRYQKLHPELIRIITADENVGMQANLLRALVACRGEFIAFCEGDDYWIDSDKLTKQINVLNKNPSVNLSFHSTYLRNFDSEELTGPHYEVRGADQIITVEEVISGDGHYMPSASLLIRKSALDRVPIGMLESAPIGDYILQVYGSLGGGAYYLNTPMCVYRRGHSESWSVSINNSGKIILFENAFAKLINLMNDDLKFYESSFIELIYRHYYPRFMNASVSGDKLLKTTFFSILLMYINDFNMVQKVIINLSRISFLAFIISKYPGVNRRVKKIQRFFAKYSTNKISFSK